MFHANDQGGAFNCDLQVEKQVKLLLEKFKVSCCIETGTYTGNTSLWLSAFASNVHTVEITDEWFSYSSAKFKEAGAANISITKSHSVEFLSKQLPLLQEQHDFILCFLDAHWENDWPLNAELQEIGKVYKNKAIIVIDDFYVPHRPLQYDKYKDQACDLSFVKDALKNLGDYVYYYSNTAENYHPSLRPHCIGVGKLYVVPTALMNQFKVKPSDLFHLENNIPYANILQ